jgi:hypothetical protein
MSLVGSVSLTNKNGLFLGSVNVDNFNLQSNQIAFSSNGENLEGLNISVGLQKLNDNLKTIGNPDIQLTVNSIYVNDNIKSIQSAINEATEADVIYISAGSYSGLISIVDKVNIAIQAPDVGNSICEALDGLEISGRRRDCRSCRENLTSRLWLRNHSFSSCSRDRRQCLSSRSSTGLRCY